ncbi:MAG: hypothetical protein U0Q55_00060 [Vicinamibacterales bacterium]
MTTLESLTPGTELKGLRSDGIVTVVDAKWFGTTAVELTYKDAQGKPGNELLYRSDEPRLEIVTAGRAWDFDGDGALFRLVAEAHRIRLAHLFDPLLAVHTSRVDPLPHQITAVYESMLPRQPLRFLLADDPGAGKTIMAGLLIKELIARGDLKRVPHRVPGQPRRAVAGRTQQPLPPSVRDPYERQARSGAHRELVPRKRPRHRAARQALTQRGRSGQAECAGLPLRPDRVR